MSDAALARHLGLGEGGLEAHLPRDDRPQPRVVGPGRRSRRSAGSAPTGSASCPRGGSRSTSTSGSTAPSSSTTSRWSSGRCSRTRSSGSPAATSTSSRASPGQEIIDLSHWVGALITQQRDHRHPRHHARPGPHRRGGVAAARAERLALCVVAQSGTPDLHAAAFGAPEAAWAGGRRGLRRDPRALPRRPGAAGGVDHPEQVRGHLDRREGLLQARAGRGRRRRGHPLRPARHRDLA